MLKALMTMAWLLLLPGAGLLPDRAKAETVEVLISISLQQMEVFQDGQPLYVWPVSTAKSPKVTPTGSWKPQTLSKNHRSKLYDGAPMPWSIFYSGNYAIHGTTSIKRLGKPASHGCVRLHPENAKVLFRMVQAAGLADTRVTIVK
ncbi:MAG: L,D-transpeptidase [Paracoccaceae bacterium]